MKRFFTMIAVDFVLVFAALVIFLSHWFPLAPLALLTLIAGLSFNAIYLYKSRPKEPQAGRNSGVAADSSDRKKLAGFGFGVAIFGTVVIAIGTAGQLWVDGFQSRDVISAIWRVVVLCIVLKVLFD